MIESTCHSPYSIPKLETTTFVEMQQAGVDVLPGRSARLLKRRSYARVAGKVEESAEKVLKMKLKEQTWNNRFQIPSEEEKLGKKLG